MFDSIAFRFRIHHIPTWYVQCDVFSLWAEVWFWNFDDVIFGAFDICYYLLGTVASQCVYRTWRTRKSTGEWWMDYCISTCVKCDLIVMWKVKWINLVCLKWLKGLIILEPSAVVIKVFTDGLWHSVVVQPIRCGLVTIVSLFVTRKKQTCFQQTPDTHVIINNCF